jgi:hypothetical protein
VQDTHTVPGKTDLSAYPVVQCVSLREVLAHTLHMTHINFFSLDVEVNMFATGTLSI